MSKLQARPGRYLVLFTIIYIVAEICANLRRPLSFDEFTTYHLADLPDIRRIWPLIAQGIELNPPLPFWITWGVHHVFGRGEVLTRLPAIAGFWMMCLSLYHFIRRRTDPLHGFMALLLPLFSYVAWDATYARGYGLMLGSAAAALLCWQLAADGVCRPRTLVGLGLSVFVAESCHYYAIYIPAAIAIGEFVRMRERKRMDWAIWISLTLGAASVAVYLPLIRSASKGLRHFWIAPMVRFLYESYADLLGSVTIVLLLLIAFMLLKSPAYGESCGRVRPGLGRHETAVCLVLAAMPIVFYVASLFTPIAFFSRYVQPVVIGSTILIVAFASRIARGDERFPRVSIAALIWLCFAPWTFWQVSKLVIATPLGSTYLKDLDLADAPTLPVVVDSDYDFLGLYHYAPADVRARLFMLDDTEATVAYAGFDTGLRTMEVTQTFHDIHLIDYRTFVSMHPDFLVARAHGASWIIQKLLADGAEVRLLHFEKEKGVFTEDHSLFRVHIRR